MKIKINKEKYYSNPCPPITKEMWDWYWRNFYVMIRDRYEGSKKLETINIRINQAYKGFYKIHFYTSINGEPEIHREWSGSEKCYLRYWKRYDWHRDLIKLGGYDIGKSTAIKRYEERIFVLDQKEKSKKLTNDLVFKWKQYNELKEFFN